MDVSNKLKFNIFASWNGFAITGAYGPNSEWNERMLMNFTPQEGKLEAPPPIVGDKRPLYTQVTSTWGKWGVWGEGGEASGSPHNYTAKMDLWPRGPTRAPMPHEPPEGANDGKAIRIQGIRTLC